MFSRQPINLIVLGMLAIALILVGRGLFALPGQPPVAEEDLSAFVGEIPGTIRLETRSGFSARDLQAVLLPLGPDERVLPGPVSLWQAVSARYEGQGDEVRHGFDAVQLWDDSFDALLRPLFSTHLPGLPLEVAVDGPRTFLLCYPGVWMLIDSADWRRPTVYNLTPASERVVSMAITGQRAWLLLDDSRVLIMDIADPYRPREVRRHQFEKGTKSIAVRGDTLFSYTNNPDTSRHTVQTHEIGDDGALVSIGRTPVSAVRKRILWGRERLFLPLSSGGVAVYDLKDPARLQRVATIRVNDFVARMALQGESLCLLGERGRLYRVDLDREPEQVELLGQGDLHAMLLLQDDAVSAFSLANGLQVFDRHRPGLTGEIESKFAWFPQGYLLPAASGKKPLLLMSGTKAGQGVIPPETIDLEVVWLPGPAKILSAGWLDDDLLTLDAAGQLHRFSRLDPGGWQQIAGLSLNPQLRWLTVHDGHIFLGGGGSVTVVESAEEKGLQGVTQLHLSAEKTWMALGHEETLLIAAGRDGLLTLSLDPPLGSDAITVMPLPLLADKQLDLRELSLSGRSLFGAAGAAGLLVARLEASQRVELVGLLPLPGEVTSVARFGQTFLAATEQTVYVGWSEADHGLQEVGEVALAGATSLVPVDEDHWAGYSAGRGWVFLPAPVISSDVEEISPQQGRLEFARIPEDWNYQLNLFNRYGLSHAPEVLALTARSMAAP